MADTSKKSAWFLIALAWAVVLIPTVWGLSYTVQNALKIFAPQPASTLPSAK